MINKGLISILSLVTFLAATTAPAWAVPLDDVIRTLESPFQTATDKASRIYDYSATFVQESLIASLDRTQSASGRIEVAFDYAPDQSSPEVSFHWQYLEPTIQEVVSDGQTLWVYLPDNNQVIQSDIEKIKQSQQNDPMAFLTGLGNLSQNFHISRAEPGEDADGNELLSLEPRQPSQLISRLVITVDRRAVAALQDRMPKGDNPLLFPVRSAVVYDPYGNSSSFVFSDLQINRGIPAENFTFVVPAGVQLIIPSE